MNRNTFRLVYSRFRGMLVAVAETAVGHGNVDDRQTGPSVTLQSFTLFAVRHVVFAALALFGLAPVMSDAQIVPFGVHAPGVISTASGLPQSISTEPRERAFL
ncbi:hypothetical protein BN2475_50225 [Paraburkholderia ribeironis]|uniref:ESPR domain-containing protein n=1 Tax=Paraburkholderia ribeironis TaxID=1247936 RepID=A0A1N7RL22_9BURK|nr:ESPR-type extended signal peptide-containing protein [Paraburkholderia ribeironis]SIT35795.1 hypothetical protein BN2475_50225 [Paraburkholderia ribeironis]